MNSKSSSRRRIDMTTYPAYLVEAMLGMGSTMDDDGRVVGLLLAAQVSMRRVGATTRKPDVPPSPGPGEEGSQRADGSDRETPAQQFSAARGTENSRLVSLSLVRLTNEIEHCDQVRLLRDSDRIEPELALSAR
jgi:hypothetical protein